MILTCPECATSYFVDDARIAKAGRAVKCTSCGARWTARPDEPQNATVAVEPPPKPEPPKIDPGDLEIVAAPPRPQPPPVEFEPPIVPRPPAAKREAAGKVVVLAVAAVAVLALVAAAVIFRDEVARRLPASQAAYAGLGLPVNATGLVIETVHAQPSFQGGQPALTVTGTIRNAHDRPATAPALRVNLMNSFGKVLAAKIARPLDAAIPPHAARHFAIAIVDPPAGVHDLEVVFDPKAGAAPAHGAEAALTPGPVDAKPLTPGTPDALTASPPTQDAKPKHD